MQKDLAGSDVSLIFMKYLIKINNRIMEIFKKGQKVTRWRGSNASIFNTGELDLIGALAPQYDDETVFEIEGTVKLITFDHNKKIYGAYLLKKGGNNIGYVYNNHLIKAETVPELTMEQIVEKIGNFKLIK